MEGGRESVMDQDLIQPCACRGSLAYHLSCLCGIDSDVCPTCNAPFRFVRGNTRLMWVHPLLNVTVTVAWSLPLVRVRHSKVFVDVDVYVGSLGALGTCHYVSFQKSETMVGSICAFTLEVLVVGVTLALWMSRISFWF